MTQSKTEPETIAQLIAQRISILALTPEEVAKDAGFKSAVFVNMLATGVVKLQICMIKKLAAALRIDPAQLLRMTVTEYQPDLAKLVDEIWKPMA